MGDDNNFIEKKHDKFTVARVEVTGPQRLRLVFETADRLMYPTIHVPLPASLAPDLANALDEAYLKAIDSIPTKLSLSATLANYQHEVKAIHGSLIELLETNDEPVPDVAVVALAHDIMSRMQYLLDWGDDINFGRH